MVLERPPVARIGGIEFKVGRVIFYAVAGEAGPTLGSGRTHHLGPQTRNQKKRDQRKDPSQDKAQETLPSPQKQETRSVGASRARRTVFEGRRQKDREEKGGRSPVFLRLLALSHRPPFGKPNSARPENRDPSAKSSSMRSS